MPYGINEEPKNSIGVNAQPAEHPKITALYKLKTASIDEQTTKKGITELTVEDDCLPAVSLLRIVLQCSTRARGNIKSLENYQ